MDLKTSHPRNRMSLSNLEVWLIALLTMCLCVCTGLIAFSWIILKDSQAAVNTTCGNGHTASGTFTILKGATFTPALQNRSSGDFKVLAFDVQQMIYEIFQATDIKNEFKNADVMQFTNGSVAVIFNLYFTQRIPDGNVQRAMVSGIEANTSDLLKTFQIDVKSIEITGTSLTCIMAVLAFGEGRDHTRRQVFEYLGEFI